MNSNSKSQHPRNETRFYRAVVPYAFWVEFGDEDTIWYRIIVMFYINVKQYFLLFVVHASSSFTVFLNESQDILSCFK